MHPFHVHRATNALVSCTKDDKLQPLFKYMRLKWPLFKYMRLKWPPFQVQRITNYRFYSAITLRCWKKGPFLDNWGFLLPFSRSACAHAWGLKTTPDPAFFRSSIISNTNKSEPPGLYGLERSERNVMYTWTRGPEFVISAIIYGWNPPCVRKKLTTQFCHCLFLTE